MVKTGGIGTDTAQMLFVYQIRRICRSPKGRCGEIGPANSAGGGTMSVRYDCHVAQPLFSLASQRPDEVVTVCGTRVRTGRQVVSAVTELTRALISWGIQPGERVAIAALNRYVFHKNVSRTVEVRTIDDTRG